MYESRGKYGNACNDYESLDLGQIAFVSLADTYTSLTIGSGNGHGVFRHIGRVIHERVEHHHGGGFRATQRGAMQGEHEIEFDW